MCLCVLVHLCVHVCVLEVECYIIRGAEAGSTGGDFKGRRDVNFLSEAASTAGTDLKDVKILSSLSV